MLETGVVVAEKGRQVILEMVRNEACGSCHACSMGAEDKRMELTALNLCNAKLGDVVEIQLENDSFLSAVAIVYGIPLIGLLIGMVAGYYLALHYMPANVELISIISGLLIMGISFLVIRSQEKHFKQDKYTPKAVRIVK